MPDKWEYPWYAAWDLAFHCVAFGLVDRGIREGSAPADAARVVHAPQRSDSRPTSGRSATSTHPCTSPRRGCSIEANATGEVNPIGDFLARVFHKLLLNFTWWVNRKDEEGNNVFQGGFLGLDNISVIDRSMVMPEDVTLEQADGTAWMASYCLNMAWAAIELSMGDPAYEDLATKFLEHYLAIGGAMNGLSGEEHEPLGRGGRVLLRLRPPGGRAADAAEAPLAGRFASDRSRRGTGRNRAADVQTNAPDFIEADAVVRRASSGVGAVCSRCDHG